MFQILAMWVLVTRMQKANTFNKYFLKIDLETFRYHQHNGHGFGWTPVVGDGQGGLAYCGSWGRKESDTTEWLNWTGLNFWIKKQNNNMHILRWVIKINVAPNLSSADHRPGGLRTTETFFLIVLEVGRERNQNSVSGEGSHSGL